MVNTKYSRHVTVDTPLPVTIQSPYWLQFTSGYFSESIILLPVTIRKAYWLQFTSGNYSESIILLQFNYVYSALPATYCTTGLYVNALFLFLRLIPFAFLPLPLGLARSPSFCTTGPDIRSRRIAIILEKILC